MNRTSSFKPTGLLCLPTLVTLVLAICAAPQEPRPPLHRRVTIPLQRDDLLPSEEGARRILDGIRGDAAARAALRTDKHLRDFVVRLATCGEWRRLEPGSASSTLSGPLGRALVEAMAGVVPEPAYRMWQYMPIYVLDCNGDGQMEVLGIIDGRWVPPEARHQALPGQWIASIFHCDGNSWTEHKLCVPEELQEFEIDGGFCHPEVGWKVWPPMQLERGASHLVGEAPDDAWQVILGTGWDHGGYGGYAIIVVDLTAFPASPPRVLYELWGGSGHRITVTPAGRHVLETADCATDSSHIETYETIELYGNRWGYHTLRTEVFDPWPFGRSEGETETELAPLPIPTSVPRSLGEGSRPAGEVASDVPWSKGGYAPQCPLDCDGDGDTEVLALKTTRPDSGDAARDPTKPLHVASVFHREADGWLEYKLYAPAQLALAYQAAALDPAQHWRVWPPVQVDRRVYGDSAELDETNSWHLLMACRGETMSWTLLCFDVTDLQRWGCRARYAIPAGRDPKIAVEGDKRRYRLKTIQELADVGSATSAVWDCDSSSGTYTLQDDWWTATGLSGQSSRPHRFAPPGGSGQPRVLARVYDLYGFNTYKSRAVLTTTSRFPWPKDERARPVPELGSPLSPPPPCDTPPIPEYPKG